jgi:hypothetical protein
VANNAGASIAHEGACTGDPCGGPADAECWPGLFCKLAPDAACAAGSTGTCEASPDGCDTIYDPVCGCDGVTYGNDCEAGLASMSVRSAGECPDTNPGSCGGLTGASCGAGEFCSFSLDAQCGIADQTGKCQPTPEACADIYLPVCGCDGQTYPNACSANVAGTSVANEGECPSPSVTGVTCGGSLGGQCAVGEFCNYPIEAICGAADATGTCQAIPEVCTQIFDPVCGCDGVSYGSACDAASKSTSIVSQGACPPSASGTVCGGLLGARCAAGEFCNYPLEASCGSADQTGTCEPTPQVCTDLFDPVCGCDGNDYANACNANVAGSSVASQGACP